MVLPMAVELRCPDCRAKKPITYGVRGRIRYHECQECGATTGLQVHHLDETRPFDLELVVTLCHRCHADETSAGIA